ncbi:Cytochrome P450 monooxygenase patI [Colletotrichum higginsianum]|uniref:Cytochrome P450 monooxygenase patI n=1 Tax=Colletotrichum higginsianum TaxID=80884 RepID=A0A4T0WAT3_9PEZI|nr:Cytochrome P450 monooxygenase patI [Colletotrichum higginsianum]
MDPLGQNAHVEPPQGAIHRRAAAKTSCYAKQIIESDFKEQGLEEEDLAWIAGGLVDAGSATSTANFHNIVLYLAACPDVQATAAKEIAAVVGDDRAPAMSDVSPLPYVWACIEVLHRNTMPPWAIRHFTDADVTHKGFVSPKCPAVVCDTVALQFDEERYPDSFAFRPERYLGHTEFAGDYAAMADAQPRDHWTFGAGWRVCPGTRPAKSNLALMLANILWAFEIRPPTGAEKGGKGSAIDLSDDAFDMYPLRQARPFKAGFCLRLMLQEGLTVEAAF